jgi:hypothetical protein
MKFVHIRNTDQAVITLGSYFLRKQFANFVKVFLHTLVAFAMHFSSESKATRDSRASAGFFFGVNDFMELAAITML